MRAFAAFALALAVFVSASSAQTQAPTAPGDAFSGKFFGAETIVSPAVAVQQHQALSAALNALAPQRPGVRDAYIVSLGGWSDHVFEQEAKSAADVLAQRFNAKGRTIVLTNGQGAANRAFPAATPTHFAATLGRLSQVMDRDEDILILYMTSHGNPDGSFAINEVGRFQYNLSPAYLKAALDQVGVKHRLIVISSCFSGAFVPLLMNDTTIIFTAAAHNRQSFGCQPERDWTYFGDAFINQTLRGGAPLAEAFEQAKVKITEWEVRDKFEPSWPIGSVGVKTQPIQQAMDRVN
jgi:hypothetical protein